MTNDDKRFAYHREAAFKPPWNGADAYTFMARSKPVTLTRDGKPFEVGDLPPGSEIAFNPRTGEVLAVNETRRSR